MVSRMPVVNVEKLFTTEERTNKKLVIPALEKRFLCGATLKEKQRQVLRDYLDSRGDLDDDDIRHAIRLIMSTPEYQLT